MDSITPPDLQFFACACRGGTDALRERLAEEVVSSDQWIRGVWPSDFPTTDLMYFLIGEGVFRVQITGDQWFALYGQLPNEYGRKFYIQCDVIDDGLGWLWLYLMDALPEGYEPNDTEQH